MGNTRGSHHNRWDKSLWGKIWSLFSALWYRKYKWMPLIQSGPSLNMIKWYRVTFPSDVNAFKNRERRMHFELWIKMMDEMMEGCWWQFVVLKQVQYPKPLQDRRNSKHTGRCNNLVSTEHFWHSTDNIRNTPSHQQQQHLTIWQQTKQKAKCRIIVGNSHWHRNVPQLKIAGRTCTF